MARPYTLKRRAEQQAETRQRIVEAAVELHTRVGPARTTVSMVAEKAGVQRHTFYAHFPDERSLLMACSGHVEARDPLPAAAPWRTIPDTGARLRQGLAALYAWYGRNEEVSASVLRDLDQHALLREINELRFGAPMRAIDETLAEGLSPKQRAMLDLALSFHTWRTLAREVGLKEADAVAVMVRAIQTAKD